MASQLFRGARVLDGESVHTDYRLNAGEGPQRNRVRTAVIAASLAATLSAAACSSGDQGAADEERGGGSGDPLSVAMFVPENDMFSLIYQEWAEDVEEATEGRVTFEPFYGGSLVSITNAYQAVQDGTADVALVAASVTSGAHPEMAFLEAMGAISPEIFGDDYGSFYEQATEPFQEVFDDVKLLHWGPASLNAVVAARDNHFEGVDDFNGVVIRSAGRVQAEQMQLLGAAPATVDPGEIYVALQTGSVDAAQSTPTLLASSGLQEVAPAVTHLPGVSGNLIAWIMNDEVWSSLSDEDRTAIDEVSVENGIGMPNMVEEEEARALDVLRQDAQVDLVSLEQGDIDTIVETAKPAVVDAARRGAESSEAGAQLAELFGYDVP